LSSRHQKEKRARSEEAAPLLVVLHLLVVIGLVIIVNTSRTNTKSSQLSGSQRCIKVGDRWEDRDIGELKEQLMPLTVDDLLVVPNNL
jgi:hypothetical protein